MKRLFGVEVARFLSRRSVRFFGTFLLLVVTTAGVLTFVFSNRDLAAATERARIAATSDYQACLRGEFGHEELPAGFDPAKACAAPDLTQITADPRFHLTSLRDVLGGASAALVMLGLGLGASSFGAEWHHRTIATLLTWESRRVRVAVAKLAAAAVVVFIGVLTIEALLSFALIPAAAFRGTTSGTTAPWLAGVIGVGLRGAALGAMGAVLGGAIATMVRNTALALGISFAWLAVVENMIRGLRPEWEPWLIGNNAASFVAPGEEGAVRSMLGGGVLLAIYAVLIAALATQIFKRRDVA
ncbi:MAG: hypothetical protein WEB06_14215 [Actinomycetota bacterium]